MKRRCGTVGSVAVSGTSGQLLPADPDRYAVYFFAANGIRYTISDKPSPTLDNGPTIPSGVQGLRICAHDTGDFIKKPIYVVASGAGTVGFLEITDIDDSGESDPRHGQMAPT